MLDIKEIRENPDKINELLKRRNSELSIDEVLKIDEKRRKIQTELDVLRSKRKSASKQIGLAMKNKEDVTDIQCQVKKTGEEISILEARERDLSQAQRDLLLSTPNTPQITLPIGSDESFNKEIKKWGEIPQKNFQQKPHWEVGLELGLLDFERGAKLSGSRFTIYKGLGAKLERAIINFFLDYHTSEHGYNEVLPPFLVNANAMTGTGQLPKFKEDMYKCEDEDLYLIPTAEVPVTNIYANEILKETDLPMYLTAYTPCFRREAGSAGKDTRGLIRQHQFNKVELVKLSTPENSEAEHLALTENAEKMLELLGLPYRTMELCTGDLGFSANKCFDLEVWMPSYNAYKEISSCSNFGDFQARRANIRYKKDGKNIFVHTINGSGLAVGRTFAAILENFQTEDGGVKIPKVLQPYMGVEKIG